MKASSLTSHVVPFLTITTEIDGASPRNHASITPTGTASSQPQQSFHIQRREASTPVFNFDGLASATCAFSNCVYPTVGTTYILPSCTATPTPCPSVSAATSRGNCSKFSRDCSCQQPIPLFCAWHPCSWYQWFLAEDWFKTQCTDVQPIDFNSAPKCARKCLHEQSINYCCVGSTRNCFYSHGSLYSAARSNVPSPYRTVSPASMQTSVRLV